MIMALMAALLMRLRCFLLRRVEAGRNGARRAEGEMGATVERAKRNKDKEEDRLNTKVNTKKLVLNSFFLASYFLNEI